MNKNKKRKAKGIALVGVIAVGLVSVIAVGSTLAYLSTTTGTKTNMFTGLDKKITGETIEEVFDEDKAGSFTPGDVINNTPSILLHENSEAGFVALSVEYYGDDAETRNVGSEEKPVYEVISGTPMSQVAFSKYATVNGWNTGEANNQWTLIAKSKSTASELYMYNDELKPTKEAAAKASELFAEITVNAGLKTVTTEDKKTMTIFTYTEMNGNGKCDTVEEVASKKQVPNPSAVTSVTSSTSYIDANGDMLAIDGLPSFVIVVNGYAVQSTHNTKENAVQQLIDLANKGRDANDLFVAK